MKTEHKKTTHISESRKIRKPLMEKKRRARINDSLESLKQILLESKTTLKEATGKGGQRTAKLEKADILEMTVRYLQCLRSKLGKIESDDPPSRVKEEVVIRPADSTYEGFKIGVTLLPTRLNNGDIAFIVPSTVQEVGSTSNDRQESTSSVWRPW